MNENSANTKAVAENLHQTSKEEQWEKLVIEFQHTFDGLGKELDQGIMDTVVALNAVGFSTTASCEGHLDRAIAAPWVDVSTPAFDGNAYDASFELMEKAESLDTQYRYSGQPMTTEMEAELDQVWANYHRHMESIRQPLLEAQLKLIEHLNSFYENRRPPYDVLLIVNSMGQSFRLAPQGSEIQNVRPPELRAQKLAEYQSEMNAFAKYLKQLFLS